MGFLRRLELLEIPIGRVGRITSKDESAQPKLAHSFTESTAEDEENFIS